MAKLKVSSLPPPGPRGAPLELLDELELELELLDELELDEPSPQGSGGAWHLQVSALHHQPP
jgi:hypothetical protein